MPEYALTRNYLELMVELPWSKSTKGVCLFIYTFLFIYKLYKCTYIWCCLWQQKTDIKI